MKRHRNPVESAFEALKDLAGTDLLNVEESAGGSQLGLTPMVGDPESGYAWKLAAGPGLAAIARDRYQRAIEDLASARRHVALFNPIAARELDVVLIRLVFGDGGVS